MRPIKEYDLFSENFHIFFREKAAKMSSSQRSNLPEDLLNKLERYIQGSTAHFTFVEIMYIMQVGLEYNVNVVVSGGEEGISASEWKQASKAKEGKVTNSALLKHPVTECNFIIANQQLFESISYLGQAQNGPLYKSLKDTVKLVPTKVSAAYAEGRKNLKNISRFLMAWELNKKFITQVFRLPPAMIYALLYFEQEKLGTGFYSGDFKNSYNANRTDMIKGLTYLTKNGYLNKRGERKAYKYSLTAKGIEVRDKILEKVLTLYSI